jgi:transposase
MTNGNGSRRCCQQPRPGGAGAGETTARSSTASCSGCAGVPWRDLPERYGPWETVYKRFARWQTDGTWARIQASLHTQADAAGELDWNAQIDSTVVRAHQHAAGARKGGSPRSRQAAGKRSVGHAVG